MGHRSSIFIHIVVEYLVFESILTRTNNRLTPTQDVYWLLRNDQDNAEKVAQIF